MKSVPCRSVQESECRVVLAMMGEEDGLQKLRFRVCPSPLPLPSCFWLESPSPPPPVLRNRPCLVYRVLPLRSLESPPQWGAADAEIKVPSGENTELERSPFKAWSRSVHCHACYAYCQEFVFPANFYPSGPFTCIFSKFLPTFPVLAVANTGSSVGPQNKIGLLAGCRFPC